MEHPSTLFLHMLYSFILLFIATRVCDSFLKRKVFLSYGPKWESDLKHDFLEPATLKEMVPWYSMMSSRTLFDEALTGVLSGRGFDMRQLIMALKGPPKVFSFFRKFGDHYVTAGGAAASATASMELRERVLAGGGREGRIRGGEDRTRSEELRGTRTSRARAATDGAIGGEQVIPDGAGPFPTGAGGSSRRGIPDELLVGHHHEEQQDSQSGGGLPPVERSTSTAPSAVLEDFPSPGGGEPPTIVRSRPTSRRSGSTSETRTSQSEKDSTDGGPALPTTSTQEQTAEEQRRATTQSSVGGVVPGVVVRAAATDPRGRPFGKNSSPVSPSNRSLHEIRENNLGRIVDGRRRGSSGASHHQWSAAGAEEEVWIDVVGDTGDGFNSSYAISRAQAQPRLRVRLPRTGNRLGKMFVKAQKFGRSLLRRDLSEADGGFLGARRSSTPRTGGSVPRGVGKFVSERTTTHVHNNSPFSSRGGGTSPSGSSFLPEEAPEPPRGGNASTSYPHAINKGQLLHSRRATTSGHGGATSSFLGLGPML